MPTFEGSTVQEAVASGLKALNLTEAQVTTKVLFPGKKGFLGFGRKPAQVSVEPTPKPKPAAVSPQATKTPENKAAQAVLKADDQTKTAANAPKAVDNDQVLKALGTYITEVCATMKTPVKVKMSRHHNDVQYQLDTDKEGLVIGKHGRTINSLQYLAQTYFNHFGRGKLHIVLNVGNYRKRREETLKHLADKAGREVIASGKPYLLDDMPSFERKVIHQRLADNAHVDTFSEGKDPHRYVIIKSKNKF